MYHPMKAKMPARLDLGVGTALLLGLAVPFATVPVDGMTGMKVAFRTDGMERPHDFSTHAPRSVCHALALSLAFEDSDTGSFTRIACDD